MVSYRTAAVFHILICFCLILGTEGYFGSSNNMISVKTGGSVTIPCYYDRKDTNHKKFWFSTPDEPRIYTNFSNESVSVIDFPALNLFTVTMRNLTDRSSGPYFCSLETGDKVKNITTTYEPYLKVQKVPDVSVVSSRVDGNKGGHISIKCRYNSTKFQNESIKQWCRYLYKDKKCYKVNETSTSHNPSFEISDDGESFTVVMSGLMLSDSGWYFCSVGNLHVPVQLTVTARTDKNVPLWPSVSAGLLMIIILLGVCIWIWKKRSEKDKKRIGTSENVLSTDMVSTPEDRVIYSTINDEDPKINNISALDSQTETAYSIIEELPGCKACPAGGTVYCTVAPH